ncbi:MAG TPA: hypothetical protein VHA57_13005 [Actinomycetota bacterium]|nr:hypothetical protein [Actinomycetota bacterium]
MTLGEEKPVSWLAMPYKGQVFDKDGGTIGTAESLLGDENADIFHGIAVKTGHGDRYLEVPADRIPRITTEAIYTDLSASEVDSLQPYSEQKWEHLGWGGLFRRHPMWTEEGKPPPLIGGGQRPGI